MDSIKTIKEILTPEFFKIEEDTKGTDKLIFEDNQEILKKIFKNFIVVNPIEIFDFIKDKECSLELIVETYPLIKKYFPDSTIYLRFMEDAEFEEWNTVFFYILGDACIDENWEIYSKLVSEFNRLKFPNSQVKLYFELSYITNEKFALRE